MTHEFALLPPDGGERPAVVPTDVLAPVEPGAWDQFIGRLDTVPSWAWLALAGVLFAVLLLTRYRLEKALRANAPSKKASDKLGGLFYTAVGMSAILWAGVLLGSAKNLIGWGRDTLHWTDGWEYLVPATLDGVAIAFAVLMFAAVRGGRSANRAARVVWVATAVSATIGFSHEYDSTVASTFAAMYLAFLALGAMAILHELLDLFRSHTEKKVARVSPVFGLRWVTYTPNTVCAWLAWQNHPPRPLPAKPTDEQVVWYGSVRHAVAHLNMVRRAKRIARMSVDLTEGALPQPLWMRAVPWARVRQLNTVLSARDAEMAEVATRLAQVADEFAAERLRGADVAERLRVSVAEKVRAENDAAAALRQAEDTRADLEQQIARLREQSTATAHRTESLADRRITVAQTELHQATARLDQLEQQWIDANRKAAILGQQLSAAQAETVSVRLSGERSEKDAAALRTALTEATEKHRTELAETVVRLQAESAETIARIRAENVTDIHSGERSRPRSGQRSKAAEKRSGASNGARMTDEEAVQALLRKHPEPEYPWKQLEVRDVTGAGFGRIPNLLSALAEYHRSGPPENGRSAVTGEAEGRTGEEAVNGSHRRPESPNGARGDLSDDDKEDSPDRPEYASATA